MLTAGFQDILRASEERSDPLIVSEALASDFFGLGGPENVHR